jgi:hypothetical protein
VNFISARFANSTFFFLFVLLGVCFGVTGTSLAQNQYYVNANTGSDSNDGSQARPWKTIQHADQVLTLGSGGTIVHVAPGNYSGPVTTNKSGTPSARIVFLSDTKWGAKISNTNWSVNGSYVDVNGFDMTSPASGNNFAVQTTTANSVRILNNNMHDFDLSGCAQFGIVNTGNNSTPQYDNWVIGNVIRHISTYNLGTHDCVTAHGIYAHGGRSIIQNNIFSAITGPAIEMAPAPGTKMGDVISNNTFFNNGGAINIAEGAQPWDYSVINNNVIVNNGVDAPSGGSFGIQFYHVTGTHNVVMNNLIYGNKPSDYAHHDNSCTGGTPISGTDAEGNAGGCPSTNPKSDAGVGATFVSFQPDMPTAPASNFNPDNYQIKAGSNAIQGGATNCAASPGMSPCIPTTDIVGVTRPSSNLDIGAFEQGGAVADLPSAPTGLTATVQ